MKTTILYFLVIGNIAFSMVLMSKIKENTEPVIGIIGEVVTTETNTTLRKTNE